MLSPELPTVIERNLADDVDRFLGGHGLTRDDIDAWVSHPGGPKVIDAIGKSLELPPEALELTWRSLGEIANLSSASVLHILRDTIAKPPPSGSPGLIARDGSRILLRTGATALALSRRFRRPGPAWDSAPRGWRRGCAGRAIGASFWRPAGQA